MSDPTRRNILKATPFALALSSRDTAKAGWFSGGESAPAETVWDVLDKFQFTGEDGQPMRAALKTLKGKLKPVTLSYAWLGCSDAHQAMHETLAALGKAAPDLVHVIIDVNPALDNLSSATRDSLQQELRQKGKLTNNIIMLYPDAADIPSIQERMGLIPVPNPENIVSIGLYGRDGARIGVKSTAQNTPESIVGAWRRQGTIIRGNEAFHDRRTCRRSRQSLA